MTIKNNKILHMKKHIQYITVAIIALIFTGCTESDDEFFATKSVTSNGLIEVSVAANVLNISASFDRLLDQNTTSPLDLFLTTTSRKFFFNFSIQKRNGAGNWEFFIPDNVNANLGENLFGSYISGVQHLDALDTTYEYDTDITLDPGQYRIQIDPKIISANSQDGVTIIINTTTIGAPGNTLEFTVN